MYSGTMGQLHGAKRTERDSRRNTAMLISYGRAYRLLHSACPACTGWLVYKSRDDLKSKIVFCGRCGEDFKAGSLKRVPDFDVV